MRACSCSPAALAAFFFALGQALLNTPTGLNLELAELRRADISAQTFRRLMANISQELVRWIVQTTRDQGRDIRPTFVVVMRSGASMLEGALTVVPDAPVGHIGLHRDPRTFLAIEYYCKLPPIAGQDCFVLDPVMATGHTAVATADRMVPLLPRSLTYIAALTTPCAIDYLAKYHPDADVVAASLEEGVNERGEVIPGFGDVGQRLYGTA